MTINPIVDHPVDMRVRQVVAQAAMTMPQYSSIQSPPSCHLTCLASSFSDLVTVMDEAYAANKYKSIKPDNPLSAIP
jgi:hypothetical protein